MCVVCGCVLNFSNRTRQSFSRYLHGVTAQLQQRGGGGALRGQLKQQGVEPQVVALQLPQGTTDEGKGASRVPADQGNRRLKGKEC